MYKICSLFAGVGGIDLGFLQTEKCEISYANEFDKYAVQTYENNFDTKVDDKYYYTEGKYKGNMYKLLTEEMKDDDTVYQWRRKYVRKNQSNLVPTLTANMGEGGHNVPLIKTDFGIRKLTPIECFCAQGYPKTNKIGR